MNRSTDGASTATRQSYVSNKKGGTKMDRIRRILTTATVVLSGLLLLGCEEEQVPTARNSATSARAKKRRKNTVAPKAAEKAPPIATKAVPDNRDPADNGPGDDETDVLPDEDDLDPEPEQPKPKPIVKKDTRVVAAPNVSPFAFEGKGPDREVDKGERLGGRRTGRQRPVKLPEDTEMTPQQAVAAIKKSKGRVEQDEDGNVIKVFLNRTGISDKGLRPLKYLPTVKVLNITGTGVSDAGLVYLKELTQLEHLYPDQTDISDAGIASLKEALPKLIVLE